MSPGWRELAAGLGEVLGPVERHLLGRAPEEGCGVILRGPRGVLRAVPLPNCSPRPRTSYSIDPGALAHLLDTAAAAGEALACVFHSHVGAPAILSREDKEMAAPAALGAPLWPGVAWLVVALQGDRAVDRRLYVPRGADFCELPIKTT